MSFLPSLELEVAGKRSKHIEKPSKLSDEELISIYETAKRKFGNKK